MWNLIPMELDFLPYRRTSATSAYIEVTKTRLRSLNTWEKFPVTDQTILPPESINEYTLNLMNHTKEGDSTSLVTIDFRMKHTKPVAYYLDHLINCTYTFFTGNIYFPRKIIKMEGELPGIPETKEFALKSTFNATLRIKKLHSSDQRVEIHCNQKNISKNTTIYITFDPNEPFKEINHLGRNEAERRADSDIKFNDIIFWKQKQNLWESVGSSDINALIVVDTDIVQGINVTFKGMIKKLRTVAKERIDFGLVGNGTVGSKAIEVHNPSALPIQFDLFISSVPLKEIESHLSLDEYYNEYKRTNVANNTKYIDWYLRQVDTSSSAIIEEQEEETSGLRVIGSLLLKLLLFFNPFPPEELSSQRPEAAVPQSFFLSQGLHKRIYDLRPRSTITIPSIMFQPRGLGVHESYLLIKNNLTFLYQVKLSGRGGSGILVAETEGVAHNKLIIRSNRRNLERVIEKEFVLRNIGTLGMRVVGMGIGRMGCQGYGFTITNCNSFILDPHATHSLHISYELDFTACERLFPLLFYIEGGNVQSMELAFMINCNDLEMLASLPSFG